MRIDELVIILAELVGWFVASETAPDFRDNETPSLRPRRATGLLMLLWESQR